MMLPDHEIEAAITAGTIGITPAPHPGAVQPASLDLRLGDTFEQVIPGGVIDPSEPDQQRTSRVVVTGDAPFALNPGVFALASTLETVTLPADLVARLEGKSSLARLGLVIHTTAGFIDPGFSGQITLELANLSGSPILLRAGMKIGQLSFQRMSSPARRPYGTAGLGSKYQNQQGPTLSEYHRNAR